MLLLSGMHWKLLISRIYAVHQFLAQLINSGMSREHMMRNDTMTSKQQIQNVVVTFVVLLIAISAIGYLVFPDRMLSIVGITSNTQMDFLVRTLGAALIALIPGAWAVRNRIAPSVYRPILIGLIAYMFLSSAVDLYGYASHIVSAVSIPSIVFRVLLGGIITWLAY